MNTRIGDVAKVHNEMLYPSVRVTTAESGGSGSVVYSARDEKGKCLTLVLTNHHVIEECIQIKVQWDNLVGTELKKEFLSTCKVEYFKYNNWSHCIGSQSVEADIVAYTVEEDMALLMLRDRESAAGHVVNIYPHDRLDDIHVSDEIYEVGAALLHPPILTKGHIAFMNEEIDNYNFWLTTAPSALGNSGGAAYRFSEQRGVYELIGVPSRIDVMLLGYSEVPISHLSYCIPLDRIIRFLDTNHYQYVYDKAYTVEQCDNNRKVAKEAARKRLIQEMGGTVSKK